MREICDVLRRTAHHQPRKNSFADGCFSVISRRGKKRKTTTRQNPAIVIKRSSIDGNQVRISRPPGSDLEFKSNVYCNCESVWSSVAIKNFPLTGLLRAALFISTTRPRR